MIPCLVSFNIVRNLQIPSTTPQLSSSCVNHANAPPSVPNGEVDANTYILIEVFVLPLGGLCESVDKHTTRLDEMRRQPCISAAPAASVLLLLLLAFSGDVTLLSLHSAWGPPASLAKAFITPSGLQPQAVSYHNRRGHHLRPHCSRPSSFSSRASTVHARPNSVATCRWSSLLQHQLPQSRNLTHRKAFVRTNAAVRPSTVTPSMMSSNDPDNLVRPGCLIAFEPETKGTRLTLGLILDRMGKKKNMFTVRPAAAAAARSSGTLAVALRQVRYLVPGGNTYEEPDLASFEVETQVESSLIEEAWDVLLEEAAEAAAAAADSTDDAQSDGGSGGSVGSMPPRGTSDPRGMAELLFGAVDPSPQECYQAFCVLEGRDGALRFKRRRDGYYEPRTRYVEGRVERVTFSSWFNRSVNVEFAANLCDERELVSLLCGFFQGSSPKPHRRAPYVIWDKRGPNLDHAKQAAQDGAELVNSSSLLCCGFSSVVPRSQADEFCPNFVGLDPKHALHAIWCAGGVCFPHRGMGLPSPRQAKHVQP